MDLFQLPIASGLFIVLLVSSVAAYLRSRDTLAGAVVVVFASGTPVFISFLVSTFVDVDLPRPVGAVLLLGLLAQPLLTLRLAAMLHPVSQRLQVLALIAYLAAAVPVAILSAVSDARLPLPLTVAGVCVYAATAFAAAITFWSAARRRVASARFRLRIASGATVLMAGALILAVASGAMAGGSPALALASRYGVLFAALCYAAAFMAPGWLRRLWQARTAYELSRSLLSASAGNDPKATWQFFAELASGAAGVRHALVVAGDGERGARSLAAVGALLPVQLSAAQTTALLDQAEMAHQLPIEAADAALRSIAAAAPVRYLTLVRFDAGAEGTGLLVLGGEQRSLFARDDRELLAMLGKEAGLLAGRARAVIEQTRLAEQLTETVGALRAASRAKNDFLASMSHELRTPLNAILGFSDLMRGEQETDGRRSVPASWIDHVHVAGRHLLGLINDVLDLAKIEAGRVDLRPEQVDASAAVGEALAELRPLAMQKQLDISAAAEGVSLHADRGRLRQILYNLISNAIKFTPLGGSVRIEGRVVGTDAHLSVIDSGVGIAPADQERVFEEFTQVGDPASRLEGTGLGLALVRRLAEAHGGRVELTSSLGMGSRFTVILPLAGPVVATRVAASEASPPIAAPRPAHAPDGVRSILVIEDDAQAVALLRSYLEPDGYKLVSAGSGIDGIAAARRSRPAAILLDVLLPGIDGWEVLRRLKADEELKGIPVLMVSVVEEREVGLALGAVDYLLKPIERATLLAAIRRHLPDDGSRRPRVLAADDDAAALEFVRDTLEPQGYDVVLADGGRDAIYAAREGRFDLIICDLLMPDLDGFEVVAQLKAAEATRETPILILTAHALDETDKERLNGKIIGICEKGDGATGRLRTWLQSVAPPASAAGVAV